jgi:hypothetical protein
MCENTISTPVCVVVLLRELFILTVARTIWVTSITMIAAGIFRTAATSIYSNA